MLGRCILLTTLMVGCANAEPLQATDFETLCKEPHGVYFLSFQENVVDTLTPTCGVIDPIYTRFPIVPDGNPAWSKVSEFSSDDKCLSSYEELGQGDADLSFCFGWHETIRIDRTFKPQPNGDLEGSVILSITCDDRLYCLSSYTINGVFIGN